ncbi:unnamed protein product [Peronospora belbahrii]|uniref:PX domain-containing protein n=1 Tax=Peronospora belbahrii TaxID=622444 RepID=A0AAU9KSK1_9STRA|nr:unnamed protein product [Peronospora belbahrii]CAH0517007.1 unnamed protein product [Peronospora belbahrii]
MACVFPSTRINPQETGQRSGEPSTERQQYHATLKPRLVPLVVASVEVSRSPPQDCHSSYCDPQSSPLNTDGQPQLHVFRNIIAKTLDVGMSGTMKSRVRAVSSDNTKPTIVVNLPGVRLAVLTSAYDSLLHLDVTLSSAASVLLATYIVCVLAWSALSFVLALLAKTAVFVLITFYTFTGLAIFSMNAMGMSSNAISYHHIPGLAKNRFVVTPTLPLLSVNSVISSFKSSTHASKNKTDDASASKRKKLQAPGQRRVLAHLNKNRILVNVVPSDMRRRVDINLGNANIRVGKAFVQTVPGKRKPRDIYVVRVDCGAQSSTQEKHMNPVIMWDITASFDEFKQLERDLSKEVKAKKKLCGVKVPHLSSGAVLFVQPELTNHVLNARRARLQTFIDSVRSDPVLSTMGCLRKFCQAY